MAGGAREEETPMAGPTEHPLAYEFRFCVALERAEFVQSIRSLGRTRDLAYVSLEWLGDDPRPASG